VRRLRADFHNPTAVAGNAQSAFKGALVDPGWFRKPRCRRQSITYTWTQTAGAAATLSSFQQCQADLYRARGIGSTWLLAGGIQRPVFLSALDSRDHGAGPGTRSGGTGSTDGYRRQPGGAGREREFRSGSRRADLHLDAGQRCCGLAHSGTSGRSSFIAPNVAATLSFSLRVNDGEQSSAAVMETVTIVPGPPVPP